MNGTTRWFQDDATRRGGRSVIRATDLIQCSSFSSSSLRSSVARQTDNTGRTHSTTTIVTTTATTTRSTSSTGGSAGGEAGGRARTRGWMTMKRLYHRASVIIICTNTSHLSITVSGSIIRPPDTLQHSQVSTALFQLHVRNNATKQSPSFPLFAGGWDCKGG